MRRPADIPIRHLTRRACEEAQILAEREQPTRARAVVAYLSVFEKPAQVSRQERRRANRKRSPEREKARARKWHDPDPKEQRIRELNRLMRTELQKAPEEDGDVAGPLAVVARYATPHLLEDFGLNEDDHAPAFEHWLMAKFGDVLRHPDLEGYLAWRDACLQRIAV